MDNVALYVFVCRFLPQPRCHGWIPTRVHKLSRLNDHRLKPIGNGDRKYNVTVGREGATSVCFRVFLLMHPCISCLGLGR